MTTAQIHKLITSLHHRKRMSQTIDDLESKIISFIMLKGFQDKSLIIGRWKVLFDGNELSIHEAPINNFKQLELFERRSRT